MPYLIRFSSVGPYPLFYNHPSYKVFFKFKKCIGYIFAYIFFWSIEMLYSLIQNQVKCILPRLLARYFYRFFHLSNHMFLYFSPQLFINHRRSYHAFLLTNSIPEVYLHCSNAFNLCMSIIYRLKKRFL